MIDPNREDLRGRLGFLLKDSAIYGLGGSLNKAITLITFPLLARHFQVQEFGQIDLLNTLAVFFVTVLVFGQDSAVARYFYEHDDTPTKQQVVSQSFALQMILLVFLIPVLLMISTPLARALGFGSSGGDLIKVLVLQLPFFVLVNFSQGLLKWTLRKGPFLLISVGSTLATLIGILVALAFGSLTIFGLFLVYLTVRAFFGLLGLWFVREWLVKPRNFRHLLPLVLYGIPFGIICLAVSLVPMLERAAILKLVGSEALGIFAAGAKVAMLIGLIINAFETSWGPFALSIFRKPDSERAFRAVFLMATLVLCCSALALTGIGDLVVIILGSARYAGAGEIVFALAMGMVAKALGGITEVGISFAKRTHLKLYAQGLGFIVAAIFIFILGIRFGVVGVAWGSLIGYCSKSIYEAFLAQQVHPIRWHYQGPSIVFSLTLLTGLVNQFWFEYFTFLGIYWIPLFGLLGIFFIVWFGLLDRDERSAIHKFLTVR